MVHLEYSVRGDWWSPASERGDGQSGRAEGSEHSVLGTAAAQGGAERLQLGDAV